MYFTDTDEIEEHRSWVTRTKPNPQPSEMGQLFVCVSVYNVTCLPGTAPVPQLPGPVLPFSSGSWTSHVKIFWGVWHNTLNISPSQYFCVCWNFESTFRGLVSKYLLNKEMQPVFNYTSQLEKSTHSAIKIVYLFKLFLIK